MTPLIDPRQGDIEDDASSTKSRSLLSLAGSMLVEISLPKLAAAWLLLVALPCVLLGLAPLIVSAWFGTFSRSLSTAYGGLLPLALILLVVAIGWFGGRTVFRAAEQAFWALNSMAVQPGYALCREAIRHVAELVLARWLNDAQRARLRAVSAAGAGLILCAHCAVRRLAGRAPIRAGPPNFPICCRRCSWWFPRSPMPAVILFGYCAAAAFVWGMADAAMDQPRDWSNFADSDCSQAVLARGASVRRACRRRAIRLSAGKRTRSVRAAMSGSPRLLERLEAIHAREAARPHPDLGRHHRCRPLVGMGGILHGDPAPSEARRAHAADTRQPRHQRGRSHQSGAARFSDQPRPQAARDAHPVRHRGGAGEARACRESAEAAHRPDAGKGARAFCRRTWRPSPTPAGCGCRRRLRSSGRSRFR